MAKWAEKPWINLRLELDASEVEALLFLLEKRLMNSGVIPLER